MSNDLISRSALLVHLRGNVLVDVTTELEKAIENEEAAHDVDKIVEQLEKCKEIMKSPIYRNCFGKECDCSDCTVCCFNKAIEIVKAGGVSDNNSQ